MEIYRAKNAGLKPKYVIRVNNYCILVLESSFDACRYQHFERVLGRDYSVVFTGGGFAPVLRRIFDAAFGK